MKLTNDLVRIPNEYRREYMNAACKQNFLRMLIISAFVFVFESLLAIFVEEVGSSNFHLAVGIALTQVVFIPVLYYMYKYNEKQSKLKVTAISTVFISSLLLSGIFWSLFEQSWIATGSTFMLAVVTISAFIVMPPFISAALLLSAFFIFALLLPQYQMNPDTIKTLNTNTFSMTVIAWVLNHMVSQGSISSFLSQKTILEKNRELEKKNMELKDMTMRDSMTNLLNHKNSLRKLKDEVERARRIGYPLSVAMIDLDNFKKVNDTYGHLTGDEVLIRIAQILSDNSRATDSVGRYGGEEFIIIMPDTNIGDAALLVERIQTVIKETHFKEDIVVTLSCGISELKEESIHGILKISDLMLYEAKRKGKNRIEVQLHTDKKSAAIN